MAIERRMNQARVDVGEEFKFPQCSVRSFAVVPRVGGEDYAYILYTYGQQVEHVGIELHFDGGHDPIYSCPDEINSAGQEDVIKIICTQGSVVVHYFN